MKKSFFKDQKGQALVTLLFFVIIGVTLITAASFVTLENVTSSGAAEQGTLAYYAAESGIEDGLLLYLRYSSTYASIPTPTPVTTMYPQGAATVSISVSNGTVTILSKGTFGNATRTIQATETNGPSGLQIQSWTEQ